MNKSEHLNRIVAKCKSLLATAEKRTPGRWLDGWELSGTTCAWQQAIPESKAVVAPEVGFSEGTMVALTYMSDDNAFIASCAGSAEAGWRATIAAIEGLLTIGYADGQMAETIIAAWPEELL